MVAAINDTKSIGAEMNTNVGHERDPPSMFILVMISIGIGAFIFAVLLLCRRLYKKLQAKMNRRIQQKLPPTADEDSNTPPSYEMVAEQMGVVVVDIEERKAVLETIQEQNEPPPPSYSDVTMGYVKV